MSEPQVIRFGDDLEQLTRTYDVFRELHEEKERRQTQAYYRWLGRKISEADRPAQPKE